MKNQIITLLVLVTNLLVTSCTRNFQYEILGDTNNPNREQPMQESCDKQEMGIKEERQEDGVKSSGYLENPSNSTLLYKCSKELMSSLSNCCNYICCSCLQAREKRNKDLVSSDNQAVLFIMDRNTLMTAFKSRLESQRINWQEVVKIGQENFRDLEKVSIDLYEKAYKIFFELFNTNETYVKMLKEIVQSFSDHNESCFDIESKAGKGLYDHLVFQVFAHMLQGSSLEVFFRTPKDVNLRIWVSLEELAQICERVPVDPTKKTDETGWRRITDTPEDQLWLQAYLEKHKEHSATVGVTNEGKVFLNSNINECNNPDYSKLGEEEEVEKLTQFKRYLRQYVPQNLLENDVEYAIRKLIQHALSDSKVLYKHIKQYMYFKSPIYDPLPNEFKIAMWHQQHNYMDSISRKDKYGRYAIDLGGVTRTHVDEGEVETPKFTITWE